MSVIGEGQQLVFVTGKGGVGKTTVAAALGTALAAAGRRTIVCEVGAQHRVASLLGGTPGAPGEEVAVGERLWATTIDPNAALREWLARQLPSRQLVGVLTRSNLFQYFVAAAPGARELVTATKLWELAQAARWSKGREGYDVVVADLPASGHGLGMLRAPGTFADIARVGPIASQAGKVREAIADPARSAVVAVALPGELPVSETLELQDRVVDVLGRPLDAVVVNAVLADRFGAEELAAVGALDGSLPAQAHRAVRSLAGRGALQDEQLARLHDGLRVPVVELPFLPVPALGREDVEDLGAALG